MSSKLSVRIFFENSVKRSLENLLGTRLQCRSHLREGFGSKEKGKKEKQKVKEKGKQIVKEKGGYGRIQEMPDDAQELQVADCPFAI